VITPVYTGNTIVSIASMEGNSTALFSAVIHLASAGVSTRAMTAAASAAFAPPIFTGAASVQLPEFITAAAATFLLEETTAVVEIAPMICEGVTTVINVALLRGCVHIYDRAVTDLSVSDIARFTLNPSDKVC